MKRAGVEAIGWLVFAGSLTASLVVLGIGGPDWAARALVGVALLAALPLSWVNLHRQWRGLRGD
jgi:hypothetical protein